MLPRTARPPVVQLLVDRSLVERTLVDRSGTVHEEDPPGEVPEGSSWFVDPIGSIRPGR